MSSLREASQQERRVYVGNLSYDVKWHHLKDFMRQGGFPAGESRFCAAAGPSRRLTGFCLNSWRGSLCRCLATSEWNVEGGRLHVALAGSFRGFLPRSFRVAS